MSTPEDPTVMSWKTLGSSESTTSAGPSKLTLREALHISRDGDRNTVDWLPAACIYVREVTDNPYAAVKCLLHFRDLLSQKTLLQTVTDQLNVRNRIATRLISRAGKEITNPLDLVPGDTYEVVLTITKSPEVGHPLSGLQSFETQMKRYSFDDDENTVKLSHQDYMRVFAFRPYIPVYLWQTDVNSYGDLLHTISWHYGFPVQSLHHLDGMEVRGLVEMLPEKIYIAVEKTSQFKHCEYSAPNHGHIIGVKKEHDMDNKKSSDEPVKKTIFVRSMYSYRGSLQRQPCGLRQSDLTSMPHLLNVLASILHPPGHYFSKLFDKKRKKIDDPSEIESGEEYLAVPHIISHTGWNYLHGNSPEVGWIWDEPLELPAVRSISSVSSISNDSELKKLSAATSSLNISLYGRSEYERRGDKSEATSEDELLSSSTYQQVTWPSGIPLSKRESDNFHVQYLQKNDPSALGRCPHYFQLSSPEMHEITPAAIIAALNDFAIVVCGIQDNGYFDPPLFEHAPDRIELDEKPPQSLHSEDDVQILKTPPRRPVSVHSISSTDDGPTVEIVFTLRADPSDTDNAVPESRDPTRNNDEMPDESNIDDTAPQSRDEKPAKKSHGTPTDRPVSHAEDPRKAKDVPYKKKYDRNIEDPHAKDSSEKFWTCTPPTPVNQCSTDNTALKPDTAAGSPLDRSDNAKHDHPHHVHRDAQQLPPIPPEHHKKKFPHKDDRHLKRKEKPAPCVLDPKTLANSSGNPDTFYMDPKRDMHLFLTMQGMDYAVELKLGTRSNFSWKDLMKNITALLSPDDPIQHLEKADGEIISKLDQIINGSLYVAVPQSSVSRTKPQEFGTLDELLQSVAAPKSKVATPKRTKTKAPSVEAHDSIPEISKSLHEAIDQVLKDLPVLSNSDSVDKVESRKPRRPARKEIPKIGPNDPEVKNSLNDAIQQVFQKMQKLEDKNLPTTSSDKESAKPESVRDKKSPTRDRKKTSPKKAPKVSDSLVPTGRDDTATSPELLLAPSLTNLCNLILMLLEIVRQMMNEVMLLSKQAPGVQR